MVQCAVGSLAQMCWNDSFRSTICKSGNVLMMRHMLNINPLKPSPLQPCTKHFLCKPFQTSTDIWLRLDFGAVSNVQASCMQQVWPAAKSAVKRNQSWPKEATGGCCVNTQLAPADHRVMLDIGSMFPADQIFLANLCFCPMRHSVFKFERSGHHNSVLLVQSCTSRTHTRTRQ